MKNQPLIIERTFNVTVEKLWAAITDKYQLRQWYFAIEEFKPEVGFEFQFEGGKEGITYLHLCKITEVAFGKKLSYSWQYAGFEGVSFVTFELFPEGSKTRLKLTHTGLETLPVSQPGFLNGTYIPEWSGIINFSLAAFIEKSNSITAV